jgi:hypothetical protein
MRQIVDRTEERILAVVNFDSTYSLRQDLLK